MPEIFKPSFKDKRTGITRVTKFWYARIGGKRVPLRVTDKRIAERKALEIERQIEIGQDPLQIEKARRQPILEHLLDFENSLRSKGCTTSHIEIITARLRKLFAECNISNLGSVNPPAIEEWLARKQGSRGMAAQTRRHYAVHALQFGRWAVSTNRLLRNPFLGLRTNVNVDVDRRRLRRPLTPDECHKLLSSVLLIGRRRGGMTAVNRRMLYLLALSTGLRRNELGSLLPESFSLDSPTPTIQVEAIRTKNRKLATLPLRSDVVAELRKWLKGRPTGKILFPVKGKKMKVMLSPDLKAAGIEIVVAGKIADFHAFRMTFITHLSLGGVPLAVAQKLARHSDPRLTANVYTSLNLDELQKAVECLPQSGKKVDETATDDVA